MLCFVQDEIFNRYQSNLWEAHWHALMPILNYLKITRECLLVYKADDLVPLCYTDFDFSADKNERKFTSYAFTFS